MQRHPRNCPKCFPMCPLCTLYYMKRDLITIFPPAELKQIQTFLTGSIHVDAKGDTHPPSLSSVCTVSPLLKGVLSMHMGVAEPTKC